MLCDDFDVIDATLKQAMAAAKESPGMFGGRYVARSYDKKAGKDIYTVLSTDDPESKAVRRRDIDILAHAHPDKCYGIGHSRAWINPDGTVNREYFKD